MNLIRVQSSDLLSKYFGQTEEKIRTLFQVARSVAPALLFFDDFDTLAHKRLVLLLFISVVVY
jgi:transitional endoplasmic reticulum ATPase